MKEASIMAGVKTPKRFSKGELKKVGVLIVDKRQILLECEKCSSRWSPNLKEGGRLPSGYWKCPKGCNEG